MKETEVYPRCHSSGRRASSFPSPHAIVLEIGTGIFPLKR